MDRLENDPLTVLQLLVSEIREQRITFIAASLAYYAFTLLRRRLLIQIKRSRMGGEIGM